jgi:hypothetical protein
MNLLGAWAAVPSRLLAVIRYLGTLEREGFGEERNKLEAILSPGALRGEDDDEGRAERDSMIANVVNTALEMGLLVKEGSRVMFSARTSQRFREDPVTDLARGDRARQLLMNCVLDPDQKTIAQFGEFIAWFLSLEPNAPPDKEAGINREITKLLGEEEARRYHLNNISYGNLCDWLLFLGMGRVDPQSRSLLLPDPTARLCEELPTLFPDGIGTTIRLGTLRATLADHCPVFENGAFYGVLAARQYPTEATIRPALALAWTRLESRGLVELLELPDHDENNGVLVRDELNNRSGRYTHIKLRKLRQ